MEASSGYLAPLPSEMVEDAITGKHQVSFETFANSITDQIGQQHFDWNKSYINLRKAARKKNNRPQRHTNKRLSYKQRKELGLYSLDKTALTYLHMMELHKLWKEYMRELLNVDNLIKSGWKNSYEDTRFENINLKLYRADYHGALLTVSSSTCPSIVGCSGIVAMETKNCFLLVGKDNKCRNIPKKVCSFEFSLDKLKFSFYGKNLIVRPAERSNKKIKLVHPPRLKP